MASKLPKVCIIATGGTISSIGTNRLDYTLYNELGHRLNIEDILERIPEVQDIANIQMENFKGVSSTNIGPNEWLQLSQKINQLFNDDSSISGVVVTHGTATLEETAYFIHLTVKSDRPVIITGAMRPLSALGTDAEINLIDAIRLAINPESIGRGVLIIFNNEIHSARDVTKTNTLRIDAFSSRDQGILGYIDSDGKVVFYRDITRVHTTKTPFDIIGRQALPRVEIVYSYGGADGILLNSIIPKKADGLVIVGFGAGSFPSTFLLAGAHIAQSGLPVVLASRAISGRVITTPKKEAAGFIVADDLLPQKARILLMLSLTVTHDRRSIQNLFYQH